jgi:uncharacterized protein involved in outer membrane biogenesis
MIKFIFKWLVRLFFLAVVLVVVFFLSLNSILRVLVEHNIRRQTGLDAEIGKFSLGLVGPTVEIRDLKIYNPPSFGGTLFLDIPEIHAEFDRAALLRHDVHFTLLRLDLNELNIVKNQAGQTNIFALGLVSPSKKPGGGRITPLKDFKNTAFPPIDVLNVSIGKARFIDLKDQRNNRGQNIGIEDCVIKNVKSPADLAGLAVDIELHSDGFFDSLAGRKKPGLDVLKQLGL